MIVPKQVEDNLPQAADTWGATLTIIKTDKGLLFCSLMEVMKDDSIREFGIRDRA